MDNLSEVVLACSERFMREEYIEVNGLTTRFVHAGEQGPAVVLLHGLGASLESWSCNIQALGNEFRVFAPDIVYFGKSAKPEGIPDHLTFVRFVAGFMDALGLSRATLVGSSMGGAIAVRMAVDYPARVQALVLVSPAGFGRELSPLLRLRRILNLAPSRNPPPWMLQFALREVFHDPRRAPPELVARVLEIGQTPGVDESYRRVLRAGVDWRGLQPWVVREVRDCANRICQPTLVIWGRQDRVVPIKQAEVALQQIPGAQLHVFDGCGHAPMVEMADEFNALVAQFIREHAADDAAPHKEAGQGA